MGRSCIEDWSNDGFNCSVACEGIYVDIEWEEDSLLLRETTSKSKDTVQRKGDILNEKTFARMIKEYVAFRKQYVRLFRYDSKAESDNFGKFYLDYFDSIIDLIPKRNLPALVSLI